MTHPPLSQTLTDLAAPLAASLGLSLWGVEVLFGGRSVLRIFVEDERAAAPEGADGQSDDPAGTGHGVSIDQCAELSRLLGLTLEVEDIIPGAYVLEVSSPGLDRTFFTAAQLAGAVGQSVEVSLHEARPDFPGRRKFRGTLTAAPAASEGSAEEGRFTLRLDDDVLPDGEGTELSFVFSEVKKARQVHVIPEKTLPGKGGKKKDKKSAKNKAQSPDSDA